MQISSHEWLAKPGSVGRPRPGLELAILDDRGERLPARSEGRVCFKLDATPFEYKGDPEKTAESRHGDGYFSLGDVGYVDEDGYLFLCDRRADVIVSGGVNLYPAKIESVILALPFVADCCVVGAPNDEWGEEVRAVVQLCDPGADDGARAEAAEQIRAACRASLAGPEVRAPSTSTKTSRGRRRASSPAATSASATGRGASGGSEALDLALARGSAVGRAGGPEAQTIGVGACGSVFQNSGSWPK